MRNLVLLAVAAGFLETASAQNPQTVQSTNSPRVDSLRRALKLSPDMRLDWMTSLSGVDTFQLVDHFNRTKIGSDWACDESFWEIVDGELSTSPDATQGWRYLAVFLPVFNDGERQIQSVSYRWGKKAEADGIREGAMALMLDAPSYRASGYWLWHRYGGVWLWIIKDGAWEYASREGKEVDRRPGLSDPIAGDVVTGVVRNESNAVYFDYYINDKFDATVKDVTKEFPKSGPWYVGFFLRGEQVNNWVDDFTVIWRQGDNVAPAAVTDLRAIDSAAASVKLEWTSTGDNDLDGQADRFELRYSTSPITSNNFSEATLVPNLPPPAAPGQQQEFTVTGLKEYNLYYFAIKIFDEVSNASPLSNVVEAKTLSDGVAKTLTLVDGCGQTGEAGTILPVPLTAKVTDGNGVAVSNSPVQFVVMSSNGAVDGQTAMIVNTDTDGEVKTTWKLGTVAGTQSVEIRAQGLDGSPYTCTATAKAAAPAKLKPVSGDGQVVALGQAAPLPLVVLLADQYDNPNIGNPVVFNVTVGGGYFLNGAISVGKVFQALTDSSGQALARVAVSNTYGDTTQITAKWTSSNGATTLLTNFFVAAATPDFVIAVKGNDQTAARETALPESLVVQVLDAVNLPVKNYPVTFRVLSGGGTLIDNQTQVDVMTDSSGYARTSWTLGRVAGEQQVEADVSFNGKRLRNAPLVFKATATIPTGIQAEAAAVPQQFALHQNFPNPFWSEATSPARSEGNPETTIQFDLPEAGQVEMNLYDMNGREVRQLLATQMPAGAHHVLWNSQDDHGHAVNSGIYFLVLRAHLGRSVDELVATKKIILMK